MSAATRVARGAAYLDKRNPDWWRSVNRPIDLGSPHRCVLGQVYGNYWRYLREKFHLPKPLFTVAYPVGIGQWSMWKGFDAGFNVTLHEQEALWQQAVDDRRLTAELDRIRRQFDGADEARCRKAAARIKEFEAAYPGRLSNKEKVSA